MWFNSRFAGQSIGAKRVRSKVVHLSLMLSLCTLFVLMGLHRSNAESGSTAQATAAVTPLPASQPLILIWQANVVPDDLMIDANSITLDDLGNCYVSSG